MLFLFRLSMVSIVDRNRIQWLELFVSAKTDGSSLGVASDSVISDEKNCGIRSFARFLN
ncbi:hypothetical protein D3C78_1583030 [compost metagenome]